MIVRVVQLFKGHKALIQGFNAFLPRTHHIDPVVAETGVLPPHLMQVAASMGIAVNAQGIPASLPSVTSGPTSGYPQHWMPEGPPSAPGPFYGPGGYQGGYASGMQPMPPPTRPPVISQGPTPVPPVISAAASTLPPISSAGGATPTSKKSSAQFVRAISYVKKIKHRFSNNPDVYKTFLAALHSYHKEQKTIFEVYMEVANLFSEHPDLLEEFVLFLPENEATLITSRLAQSGMGPTGIGMGASSRGEGRGITAIPKRPAQPPLPPSKSSKRARQAAGMSTRTAEESAFYERVKRFLGDKQAYSEFLKCLNLFCQDIIKMQDLVHLVHRFIGSNEELFGWFKRYIGYTDQASVEGPIWKLGSALVNEHGELNLQACKKVGSYRIYPKSHLLPKSSHRTAIGLEVLNDSMVSCPVFNSEDSTFIASKKNQYEEALFRCEDERFEMDLLIEYNLATIAVFEPLAKKVELMSTEERSSFTLGPTLGGSSAVIYKKAIKKIYGDKGDEVILGLQKNPAVAVPVVLRRLKQKDEEWRRVQRDWNKIWRDVHLKNYYKALDHQGIEFKANDRRNISGRALISEIEVIAGERRRGAERGETYPPYQMEFTCKGTTELAADFVTLIKSFVKNSPSFARNDRKAVLRFMSSFIPGFFALSTPDEPEQILPHRRQSDGNKSEGETSSGSSVSDSEIETEDREAYEEAIIMAKDKLNVPEPSQTTPILLFANSNLYVLIRLLQMSLERLEKMQSASMAANGAPFFVEKKNVVASFLDLQSQSESTTDLSGNFYRTLLILLRQLVCGSIDPGMFEERVRFMFGTAAYPIFTFDKLLQTFVKQVQLVLSDPSCEQLIRLFDSWNSRKSNVRISEYSIRMAVESAVPGKENIYRIDYVPKTGRMTLQVLDRLSDSTGPAASAESRWSTYVDNFVKLESNPKYLNSASKVFLSRCRRKEVSVDPSRLVVQYNLECKIAINTYKLFYVENTEDFLVRLGRGKARPLRHATKRFKAWLVETGKMDVDEQTARQTRKTDD